ncbi:MAG TPA: hypothetical protein DD412_07615 [Holosporales bacterium]|nr:hypothetical protein [Holosporales bacterium]
MSAILIDIPEVIETERLQLHAPKAGWGEKLYPAFMDGWEDYVKWLSWPDHKPTLTSVEEDCRRHHADFILRNFVRYLIIDKDTQQVLGRCGFPPMQSHWHIPQFGISYFLRKSFRGKGMTTEASHALALLAFKVLRAQKVEIYCDSDNVASTRIPQKLNFELEYTQRGGWLQEDGSLAALQTYSLFSQDALPDKFVKFF